MVRAVVLAAVVAMGGGVGGVRGSEGGGLFKFFLSVLLSFLSLLETVSCV